MADPQPRAEAAPPPDFSVLIASLSTQAMMALGIAIEKEAKEAPKVDLPTAQNLIDLLAMLEEKTRGNLSPDEASMMKHVLHDLRMAFVEISRKS